MIDPRFVKRVYRTTIWVAAIILIYLVAATGWKVVAGFVVGVVVGLALLKSHEVLVPCLLARSRSSQRKQILSIVGLLTVKYAALGVLLWAVCTYGWVSGPAFFAGFVLVQAIIFLKVMGLFVLAKMGMQPEHEGAQHGTCK